METAVVIVVVCSTKHFPTSFVELVDAIEQLGVVYFLGECPDSSFVVAASRVLAIF